MVGNRPRMVRHTLLWRCRSFSCSEDVAKVIWSTGIIPWRNSNPARMTNFRTAFLHWVHPSHLYMLLWLWESHCMKGIYLRVCICSSVLLHLAPSERQGQVNWIGKSQKVQRVLRTHASFPGGSVLKNPRANARDTGMIPDLGRSHVPQSNSAHEPQLLRLCPKAQK